MTNRAFPILVALVLSFPLLARAEATASAPFTVADQDDLQFSDLTVDVRDDGAVEIAADVTLTGAVGHDRTDHIIAILIGFMDYTDDACLLSGVPARGQAALRACAVMGRAWRAYQHNQSDYEFNIVSPRDAASGLPTGG